MTRGYIHLIPLNGEGGRLGFLIHVIISFNPWYVVCMGLLFFRENETMSAPSG